MSVYYLFLGTNRAELNMDTLNRWNARKREKNKSKDWHVIYCYILPEHHASRWQSACLHGDSQLAFTVYLRNQRIHIRDGITPIHPIVIKQYISGVQYIIFWTINLTYENLLNSHQRCMLYDVIIDDDLIHIGPCIMLPCIYIAWLQTMVS